MKEVKSVLKRTTLFGKLDQETLRELATCAVEQRLNRDAVLFVAGDEVPVFDGGAHFTTVNAEEETRVLFVEKSRLRTLCLKNPAFALNVLKELSGQVRDLAVLIEELTLREVGERLVGFLLSEADRIGEVKTREIHLKSNLTHAQIAARVGTVREVISRNLARLKSDGLIRIENRQLIITDRAKLLSYAKKRNG